MSKGNKNRPRTENSIQEKREIQDSDHQQLGKGIQHGISQLCSPRRRLAHHQVNANYSVCLLYN